MYSLKRRLLLALIFVLTLTTFCTGLAMYFTIQSEVDRLLDNSLKQVALSYQNLHPADFLSLRSGFLSKDQDLVVQIYDPISGLKFISRKMDFLPIMERVGFSDIQIEGKPWRIFTAQNPLGQIIEVAQPTIVRSETAVQAAKTVLLPLLIMMLLAGLVIWVIVGQGFNALSTTVHAIERRSPASLNPLSMKGLPTEISPLVSALNLLLSQLDESLKAQKRFASDAAHELRTPLTALTLQLQLAQRAKTDETRQKAFEKLREGIKRATRLVSQLLTMSRLDPENRSKPLLPLDLHALAQSVVEEMSLVAAQKNIEIKAIGNTPVIALGNEDALRLLINNLCDNAIRYTHNGGHIEIKTFVDHNKAEIEVSDDGPGIPEAERERIFERFYRAEGTKTIPGTGLGLAIVRRVAEIHGGHPSVGEGIKGKGASFKIEFPARPSAEAERAS